MISLEALCLNFISQEFKRFHFAFTVSKDEKMKYNVELLKRNYSYQLLSKLGKLKDEYIEFLINEHLKELHSDWFDKSHYKNSMEDILCRLPNLQNFYFPEVCTDRHLESIARFCPKLVEINVRSSTVADSGIAYLCKDQNGIVPCPELKKLFIEDTFIKDESVKCLIRDLPSLEIIDYPDTPQLLYDLHKEDLPELENIRSYELTELDLSIFLSSPHYADILKVCLKVCPKLKSVACFITDKEQLKFFSTTNLVQLNLQFTMLPKVNIENFLKNDGNNLVSLKLDTCLVSIVDLVVNCPKLKDLHMNKVDISDGDSQLVITSLVECTFQNIPKKEVIFILLSSPNLKCITFNSCVLFIEIKTHILKLVENRSVENITFKDCWVETSFARDILLNSSSSMELALIDCDYNAREMTEIREFAAKLDHKPKLFINDLFSSSDSEEENDFFNYYNVGYSYPQGYGCDNYGGYFYDPDIEEAMGSPSD